MNHGWIVQSENLHGGVDMEVTMTDLLGHPAVKAWRAIYPESIYPHRIFTLKPAYRKSAVYRLEGIGLKGSNVIAKRCRQVTAMTERTIYKSIFPYIPAPTLHYYGSVENPEGKFCWIFLEDVGDVKYYPSNSKHLALGAHWLGTLHTSASRLAEKVVLPERTLTHYLDILRSARYTLISSQTNPVFSNHDLKILEAIVSHCNLIEKNWNAVKNLCEKIPLTLVHGGFYSKNVRVQKKEGKL